MPEPSAWLLIINHERNRFQANIALKKKKASSHTRAAICRVLLVCQAMGGGRSAGGGEGRGCCWVLHHQQGWLTSSLPFATVDRYRRERKEHLLALTSLDTMSEESESTIPSRCGRWVTAAPTYRGLTVGSGIVRSSVHVLTQLILTTNLCVPIL